MDQYDQLIKQGDQALLREKNMDAVRAYTSALSLKDSEDEQTAELLYKMSQAYAALDSKNMDNPKKYAVRALDIHKKIGMKELEVLDLLNLAYIDSLAGDSTSSNSSLESALSLSREIGDGSLIATSLMSKADSLSGKSSTRKEAQKLFAEASLIAEKDNAWETYFEAQYGLIGIMRANSDPEGAFAAATKLLDKVDQVCKSIPNKKERADFRKSLSYLYDLGSDLAMELENVEEAIKIAQRLREA
ncbi:MAG: hypothetical protein M1151_03100 [Candidatus Thermoplasmatota archaeon]|jgi:tetratricopeptide (TPR) repeat protein|nr:hypothetical protein [Candidatus Thermoplasmatota archaeon]MCL5785642.1 hypothetical protein [Candidatus Thermoplasmatota archaeon]